MKEEKQKNSVESIKNQYITSPFLVATVPVRQIVKPTPEWEEGSIVRRNGQRTITVRVDVDRQTLAYTIIGKIRPQIDTYIFNIGRCRNWRGANDFRRFFVMGSFRSCGVFWFAFFNDVNFNSITNIILVLF